MRIQTPLRTSVLSLVAFVGIPLYAQGSDGIAQQKTSCAVQKDEIEVYASYLTTETNSSSLAVVVTRTQPSSADIDTVNLRLAAQSRGIPADVRADFKEKDKISCSIEPFQGVANLRFISRTEYHKVFKAGWNEFHKRYGKHASWVELSRVGFNAEKTLALLHVSSGVGPMGAGGFFYLLECKAGKWVIKSYAQTWAT
jgi:hypothetical protein